jgi:hypothetical protein
MKFQTGTSRIPVWRVTLYPSSRWFQYQENYWSKTTMKEEVCGFSCHITMATWMRNDSGCQQNVDLQQMAVILKTQLWTQLKAYFTTSIICSSACLILIRLFYFVLAKNALHSQLCTAVSNLPEVTSQFLIVAIFVTADIQTIFCVYSFGYIPGVKFDAGDIPKRIHTIFKTRRNFEIK